VHATARESGAQGRKRGGVTVQWASLGHSLTGGGKVVVVDGVLKGSPLSQRTQRRIDEGGGDAGAGGGGVDLLSGEAKAVEPEALHRLQHLDF